MMRAITRTALANPHLPIPVYLAVIGIIGAISGRGIAPDTLVESLPFWLVHSWTLAIAIGGLFATGGCVTQRTRVESAGLALLLAGIGLYGAVIIPATSGAGVAAILALGSVCGIRMLVLSRAREARQGAQRLLSGEEHH